MIAVAVASGTRAARLARSLRQKLCGHDQTFADRRITKNPEESVPTSHGFDFFHLEFIHLHTPLWFDACLAPEARVAGKKLLILSVFTRGNNSIVLLRLERIDWRQALSQVRVVPSGCRRRNYVSVERGEY